MRDNATPSDHRKGLAPGFADPVLEAQSVFRSVMCAMAEPGRVIDVVAAIDPPPGLPRAAIAMLLALIDFETSLWLPPSLASGAVGGYLRFHTGAPLAADPQSAQFAAFGEGDERPALAAFAAGDERYPDRSATLIVPLAALDGGAVCVRLSGPGIQATRTVAPAGLDAAFWSEVQRNNARYPLGIDLILASGDAILALPRSTRVEIG